MLRDEAETAQQGGIAALLVAQNVNAAAIEAHADSELGALAISTATAADEARTAGENDDGSEALPSLSALSLSDADAPKTDNPYMFVHDGNEADYRDWSNSSRSSSGIRNALEGLSHESVEEDSHVGYPQHDSSSSVLHGVASQDVVQTQEMAPLTCVPIHDAAELFGPHALCATNNNDCGGAADNGAPAVELISAAAPEDAATHEAEEADGEPCVEPSTPTFATLLLEGSAIGEREDTPLAESPASDDDDRQSADGAVQFDELIDTAAPEDMAAEEGANASLHSQSAVFILASPPLDVVAGVAGGEANTLCEMHAEHPDGASNDRDATDVAAIVEEVCEAVHAAALNDMVTLVADAEETASELNKFRSPSAEFKANDESELGMPLADHINGSSLDSADSGDSAGPAEELVDAAAPAGAAAYTSELEDAILEHVGAAAPAYAAAPVGENELAALELKMPACSLLPPLDGMSDGESELGVPHGESADGDIGGGCRAFVDVIDAAALPADEVVGHRSTEAMIEPDSPKALPVPSPSLAATPPLNFDFVLPRAKVDGTPASPIKNLLKTTFAGRLQHFEATTPEPITPEIGGFFGQAHGALLPHEVEHELGSLYDSPSTCAHAPAAIDANELHLRLDAMHIERIDSLTSELDNLVSGFEAMVRQIEEAEDEPELKLTGTDLLTQRRQCRSPT